MIYKKSNLKISLTDLEWKIMNLCPKNNSGIFKQIYNNIIFIFALGFVTVFIILLGVANIFWS